MSEDMSNIMEQFNNMLGNASFPSDLKDMINNLSKSSQEKATPDMSSNENESSSEFDMNTMLKIKAIMDSLKSSQSDPRANLLKSLKPYLKESRKAKVDQYIQIFGMEKAFEMLNPLGGGNPKW